MTADEMTTNAPGPGNSTGPAIRVLVVDDHAPVRRLIAEVLAGADDITVVGECVDGDEVVDAVIRTRPDVVLMDVSMPRVDGLEATRRLLAVRPGARVLLLTATSAVDSSHEARRAGAMGSVSKEDLLDLPARARSLAAGGTAWG
jgi:DNA-binding NarL/FixJ family response regulator